MRLLGWTASVHDKEVSLSKKNPHREDIETLLVKVRAYASDEDIDVLREALFRSQSNGLAKEVILRLKFSNELLECG